MISLGIDGAWVRETKVFRDARGSFHEWFQGTEIRADVGRDFPLRQANCVVSNKGALRGIHYTQVPPGQAKYITCVRGAVLSAVVDIRVGSPTFGDSRTVTLDDREFRALYVSEGLGHGLMALADDTVIVYVCSETYNPRLERGLHPLDPGMGIRWPAGITPDLSDKDSTAPSLADAERQGQLPRYADCVAGAARTG
jgi:dTDP-4-dehydrorhamnose 3,5-epimerase